MDIPPERLLNIWCVFINIVGIIANLLVIGATYKCRERELKTYSTLIRITSMITISMAVAICLGSTGVLTIGNHIFFFNRSIAGLTSPTIQDVILIFKVIAVLWYNTMSPITFFFRYCIVVRQCTPNGLLLGFLTLIGLVQGLIVAVGFYSVETDTNSDRPDLAAVLMSSAMLDGDVSYFRVSKPERGIFVVIDEVFLVTNLFCTVFFATKIVCYLRSQSKLMSLNSRRLQTRLNITFITQTSYPLLLLLSTVTSGILPQCRIWFPASQFVFYALTSMIPLVDAATLLVAIPSFRRAIFGSKKGSRHSTTPVAFSISPLS